MKYTINYIIDEIRENEVGIAKIALCDASRYAKNATGTMVYAGTLFTKKHADRQEGDEVIQTGNKETNLSQVKRTLTALAGKGEVEVRFLDGDYILGEIEEFEHTYDVEFNSDTSTMSKGWHDSVEYCKDYIRHYNGTNESYFEDFKGGTVSIRCNETEEIVYEEEVR